MQVPFGNGSWCVTMRFTWTMYYPWPPFQATYPNEPGLQIHLSPSDTQALVRTLQAALSGVGIAIANVFGAFAGVVATIAEHLIENSDGSLDIRMSEHGFEAGNAPSADPNVWINGAWAPVAAALKALGQLSAAPPRQPLTLAPPTTNSHGELKEEEPFDLPANT
jgi:hypothetical protein